MGRGIALLIVLCLHTVPALAQVQPPLPRERPERSEPTPAPPTNPEADVPAAAPEEQPALVQESEKPEPPRVYQTACPAVLTGAVEAETLPPIFEGQCLERSPLAVTALSVNGRSVPLSGAITTSCAMATALPEWVAEVDGYLWARENTRVESVLVGTSYMCRNVGAGETGRLSEHAFANALDVIGFTLEDGRSVTLPAGWIDSLSPEGRLLRYAHDAACSRFTTTLGPEANAEHHDHLHLDFGCHGQNCTARLCE